MTQNYLFLDIDGPLLPTKSHMFPQNQAFVEAFQSGISMAENIITNPPMFDPWCVRAHNLLAQYGNAKIVIVSNWRIWATNDELKKLFAAQGLEFEYADPVGCMKRGISSERVHDVSYHMSEEIPDDSRVLILDDDNLEWLNNFHPLEDVAEGEEHGVYGFPTHYDQQVGYIEDKSIRWKWLDISLQDGITYQQFGIAADFFEIDRNTMNEK